MWIRNWLVGALNAPPSEEKTNQRRANTAKLNSKRSYRGVSYLVAGNRYRAADSARPRQGSAVSAKIAVVSGTTNNETLSQGHSTLIVTFVFGAQLAETLEGRKPEGQI